MDHGGKVEAARGNCYQAAYLTATAYAKFHPGMAPRLCHGVARQSVPPRRKMGHAWCEIKIGPGVFCVDGMYPREAIPQKTYYRAGQINRETVIRYTVEEAMALQLRFKHFGPYDPKVERAAHAND